MPKLTEAEAARLQALLQGVADHPEVQKMRDYTQHGRVTTYEHCARVAALSYWLACRLRIRVDEQSLVRGAFLHDFYLNDWHDCAAITRLHGFTHPAAALENAQRLFPLNATEQDIIQSHMWPLTLTRPPRRRESVLVCLADKLCTLHETFCRR